MLELLNQLDGFDTRGDVKVIMATNKIESLDPALIRPGRIDRKIEFPLPDVKTKRHIFKYALKLYVFLLSHQSFSTRLHTARMSLNEDVDLEEFIMMKDDLSGADIKAVCTEAGLLALRERRMRVNKADFTAAREKVCFYLYGCEEIELMCLICRFSIGRMRALLRVFTFSFGHYVLFWRYVPISNSIFHCPLLDNMLRGPSLAHRGPFIAQRAPVTSKITILTVVLNAIDDAGMIYMYAMTAVVSYYPGKAGIVVTLTSLQVQASRSNSLRGNVIDVVMHLPLIVRKLCQ